MLQQSLDSKQQSFNQKSVHVKCAHLTDQNQRLRRQIKSLEAQLNSTRKVSQQLSSQKDLNCLQEKMVHRTATLEQTIQELTRQNQEISCDLLMKSQLLCESEHEFKETLTSYQEKIFDLRMLLGNKELTITQMEEQRLFGEGEMHELISGKRLEYVNEVDELRNLNGMYQVENREMQLELDQRDDEIYGLKKQISQLKQSRKRLGSPMGPTRQTMIDETVKRGNYYSPKARIEKSPEHPLSKSSMVHKFNNYHLKLYETGQPVGKSELKQIASYLNQKVHQLTKEKKELLLATNRKAQQAEIVKQGYQMLKQELLQLQVQNQFLRSNFKELAQVPAARKIRYYLKHYDMKVPKLEAQLHEKDNLIAYWKQWHKKSEEKWSLLRQRLLDKRDKKIYCRRRISNSCTARLPGSQVPEQKPEFKPVFAVDTIKENAIMDFINEGQKVNSLLEMEGSLGGGLQDPFMDEFSVIKNTRREQYVQQ